jgi:tRNA G18 (ribose-2'-O)-methylase SpoU
MRPPDPSPHLEPYYAGQAHGDRAPIPRRPLRVVLDNLRSAYNVGSIFRTADAGAVEHIYLCGMTAHPPHNKLEKTALGAFDYVPWSYHERTQDVLAELGREGVPRIALEVAPHAATLGAYEWPQPAAIVFGNEVTGINADNLSRCDAVVSIPMWGYKNSMNVATAFGIVVYDVLRHWGIR